MKVTKASKVFFQMTKKACKYGLSFLKSCNHELQAKVGKQLSQRKECQLFIDLLCLLISVVFVLLLRIGRNDFYFGRTGLSSDETTRVRMK